ncbi:MAG: SDR family NAD(P)-dependent oxidoreductase [Campylobacterales bacterium]|nr:SDR family NAD(P)-dependent oxidoreductase [Campylobacterales bacterium]HEO98425.1 SDR family NAD(P)-dependent oxidoreductase [Campylobacterota bacterium]
MKNVFITGVNTGLGNALAVAYLSRGYKVYAVGREVPSILDKDPNFFFFPYDLSETYMLKETLKDFIEKRPFEVAILNAGVLGEIKPLNKTSLMEIKEVMEINVWANKEIIDALSEYAFVQQIVGISSGASVSGSKGWGTYALSKSSLNMLLKVYAKELPDIHFTALAPGVIDTAMVRHIIHNIDERKYPSVSRLKEGKIQSPKEAAHLLIETFPKLYEYESGSFLDVRTMED